MVTADILHYQHARKLEMGAPDTITQRQSVFYRTLVSVALAMISFGQFNDTKELLTGLYDDITTNFTHNIQFEQLENLSIGRTTSYVEAFFGPPEVLKPSKLAENVVFQYYNIDKAVVTILNHQGRVAGFVVIPVSDDFAPQMPYVDSQLGEKPIGGFVTTDDLFFDASNLIYFAETQDLGKQFLFLQRVFGFVEYGGLSRELNEQALSNASSNLSIRQINELYIANEIDAASDAILRFRDSQTANFYAYTELDPALIPESLLTRFEFNTYFGAAP